VCFEVDIEAFAVDLDGVFAFSCRLVVITVVAVVAVAVANIPWPPLGNRLLDAALIQLLIQILCRMLAI